MGDDGHTVTKRTLSEGLGSWISSLRFSGFTVLIVALIVVGGVTISPTLTTFVNQQRENAELRETVRLQNERVNEADAERAKWQDPAYVRSQARGRLFYVMPGETQLSIIEDVVIPEDSTEVTSDTLTEVTSSWARTLAVSTLVSGLSSDLPHYLPEQDTDESADAAPAEAPTAPSEPTAE